MTTAEQVPFTIPAWANSPKGYIAHQEKLQQFIEFFENIGIEVSLPKETGQWDKGIDATIDGKNYDLKSFPLRVNAHTMTWDSPRWEGEFPKYEGQLTDFYIHPNGDSVKDWYIIPASALRRSEYGYGPYYWRDSVSKVSDFIKWETK